jgi:hypothetical protein
VAEGWEVKGPMRREPTPQVHVGPPFPEGHEAGVPAYKIDLPEAKDAAELHSIYRDLEFTVDTVNYLVQLVERREEQTGTPTTVGAAGIFERALYMAALITYVRCFTSGKRKYKLDDSIFTGDAEHLLERHRYYRDTRDKHVAHSVNAFEITEFAAWIDGLDTDDPDILMVGAVYTTRTSDALDDLRWMVKLATYVQTIVYGRMNRADGELEKRIRSLPKEELKKLKVLTVEPPHGPHAAATPRQ